MHRKQRFSTHHSNACNPQEPFLGVIQRSKALQNLHQNGNVSMRKIEECSRGDAVRPRHGGKMPGAHFGGHVHCCLCCVCIQTAIICDACCAVPCRARVVCARVMQSRGLQCSMWARWADGRSGPGNGCVPEQHTQVIVKLSSLPKPGVNAFVAEWVSKRAALSADVHASVWCRHIPGAKQKRKLPLPLPLLKILCQVLIALSFVAHCEQCLAYGHCILGDGL